MFIYCESVVDSITVELRACRPLSLQDAEVTTFQRFAENWEERCLPVEQVSLEASYDATNRWLGCSEVIELCTQSTTPSCRDT